MMKNMNTMNDRELEQITGGCDDLTYLNIKRDFERLKQQEEARQKAEAARQEAIRRAEEANQPSIHAHGGGVSGGW